MSCLSPLLKKKRVPARAISVVEVRQVHELTDPRVHHGSPGQRLHRETGGGRGLHTNRLPTGYDTKLRIMLRSLPLGSAREIAGVRGR